MAHVRSHVVACHNARGGRSAAERVATALRCLYCGVIAEHTFTFKHLDENFCDDE
jgi:hypothetical protein